MKKTEFPCTLPEKKADSIAAVKEFATQGPWRTKSEGELNVLLKMPLQILSSYLSYDMNELANISEDIRGLRLYSVRKLKKGSRGGGEFHRIRKEIVIGMEGRVQYEFEDVYKNKRTALLLPDNGFFIPQFMMHSYEVIEDSGLLVVANTLFNPLNPATHDTYSAEIFQVLQQHYKKM
ncbi:cupin domain-containing protein [Candidatus Woesearchaeota archaeon]|nr:cupin domain-containing protein [Candidatus Woesearchaeota archaeon]